MFFFKQSLKSLQHSSQYKLENFSLCLIFLSEKNHVHSLILTHWQNKYLYKIKSMLNIIIESIKYLDLKTSTGELNVDWRAELITLKVRLIRLLYIQCACGYSTLSSVTENLTNSQHLNFLQFFISLSNLLLFIFDCIQHSLFLQ